MGFLASLFGKEALSALVGSLLSPLELMFRDYINGKISKEQLAEQIQAAMLAAFAQVEASFLDSMTKTYVAFVGAAAQNPVMTRAWSVVLYSQLSILLWHQFVIPFLVTFGFVPKYASSGATVDWAYALVALCLGAPAVMEKVGIGTAWAADNLKRLVGK